MANRVLARKFVQLGLIKNLRYEADAGDGLQNVVVDRNYSGAFLSPVLEGVESEVAEAGSFGVAVDSDDAALLPELIVVVVVIVG